jgi:hypothetical protein
MLDNIDIRKWIIAGLLIVHIAWIGNHMRWVANGEIDPWKLGGYAMYTVPDPSVRLRVYLENRPDTPIQVKKSSRYYLATYFANIDRAFRCADIPAAALLAFFEENTGLIGSNLAFIYSDLRVVGDPPSVKRMMQGMVVVTWQDTQTFTYTNRFCGNEHVASATLPENLFGTLP